MEATRIRLAEGVHLTYLPARKFKTSLLSAQFVTPLRRETAGANALLAAVLMPAYARMSTESEAVIADVTRLWAHCVRMQHRAVFGERLDQGFAGGGQHEPPPWRRRS